MGIIKGIPVTLYERQQTDVDAFNAPVYSENIVVVDDVVVTPADSSATDVVTDLQLYGKKIEYLLCIPKGDAHTWEDCRVDFMGKSWRVVGAAQEWMEHQVPLRWNKKVRVVRYG